MAQGFPRRAMQSVFANVVTGAGEGMLRTTEVAIVKTIHNGFPWKKQPRLSKTLRGKNTVTSR